MIKGSIFALIFIGHIAFCQQIEQNRIDFLRSILNYNYSNIVATADSSLLTYDLCYKKAGTTYFKKGSPIYTNLNYDLKNIYIDSAFFRTKPKTIYELVIFDSFYYKYCSEVSDVVEYFILKDTMLVTISYNDYKNKIINLISIEYLNKDFIDICFFYFKKKGLSEMWNLSWIGRPTIITFYKNGQIKSLNEITNASSINEEEDAFDLMVYFKFRSSYFGSYIYDGKYLKYDRKGKIVSKGCYKNGKLVDSGCF